MGHAPRMTCTVHPHYYGSRQLILDLRSGTVVVLPGGHRGHSSRGSAADARGPAGTRTTICPPSGSGEGSSWRMAWPFADQRKVQPAVTESRLYDHCHDLGWQTVRASSSRTSGRFRRRLSLRLVAVRGRCCTFALYLVGARSCLQVALLTMPAARSVLGGHCDSTCRR